MRSVSVARARGAWLAAALAAAFSGCLLPAGPGPVGPPRATDLRELPSLVAAVTPAVVNVTIDVHGPQVEDDVGPRQWRKQSTAPEAAERHALGTGFLVDAAGHVVTNAHVVEGATRARVKLADDREFDASVRGRDEELDLAILTVEGAPALPYVRLGSSAELQVGEQVVAIGEPFGLGYTVTLGIVSGKGRTIGAGPYDDFIQTDASINPGNSGGPLFNLRGEVVGINTAINPAGHGIGFAIPIDEVLAVLPRLIQSGSVLRGRLGVSVQRVDVPMAVALRLSAARGALVGDVEQGSAAARAGIRPGDVITRVGQWDVPRSEDLARLVARFAPGSTIDVVLVRDGVPMTASAVLDRARDAAPRKDDVAPAAQTRPPGLGIEAHPTLDGIAIDRVLPGALVEGTFEPGDVVVEVNRAPVRSLGEFQGALVAAASRGPVMLTYRRAGKTRFAAVVLR